jgi:hypothetical protein
MLQKQDTIFWHLGKFVWRQVALGLQSCSHLTLTLRLQCWRLLQEYASVLGVVAGICFSVGGHCRDGFQGLGVFAGIGFRAEGSLQG